jgi:hypothetical protein
MYPQFLSRQLSLTRVEKISGIPAHSSNDSTIPGFDLRVGIGSVKAVAAWFNLLMLRFDKGLNNDPRETAVKSCDFLVGIVSFTMGSVVVHDELNAPDWRDYSRLRSGEQCAANVASFEAQMLDSLAYASRGGADPEMTLFYLGLRVVWLTARTGVLAAKFGDAYKHKASSHLF